MLSILRPRAATLPAPEMVPILALMFLAMVADGLNSTFQSVPGGHGLWVTTNLWRVVTGTLAGLSIAFFLYPLFNAAFWRPNRQRAEPAVEHPYELFGYGVILAALVGLTLAADGDRSAAGVYWAISLLSVAGLLLLLTLVNTLLVSLVTRREGQIPSWQAAATPLLLALLLAVGELVLLAYMRGELSHLIGPLPPGMPVAPGIR